MRSVWSNIFGTLKLDFMIKTREMFSFPALTNNSVTIELSFLLLRISAIVSSKTMFYLFYLGCILQCFCKYHPNHSSIQ